MAKVQLPDNSFEARAKKEQEQPQKIEKVIEGSASVKQKSRSAKWLGYFVNDDVGSVKEWVFKEVLVPRIKDILFSIVTGSSSMLIYGETYNPGARRSRRNSSGASWRGYYEDRDRYEDRYRKSPRRDEPVRMARNEINTDILFDTYDQAMDVIEKMKDWLYMYPNGGIFTVKQYYELCFDPEEMPPIDDWAYNAYGWTNVDGARPVPCDGGKYIIRFPRRPIPID